MIYIGNFPYYYVYLRNSINYILIVLVLCMNLLTELIAHPHYHIFVDKVILFELMVLEGRIRARFLLGNNVTITSYEYFSFLWDNIYLRICYLIIYFLLEV